MSMKHAIVLGERAERHLDEIKKQCEDGGLGKVTASEVIAAALWSLHDEGAATYSIRISRQRMF